MSDYVLVTAYDPPPSLARVREPRRAPFRIAAVQQRWRLNPGDHQDALAAGIRLAASEGAQLVCLQELTLSQYFAITPDGPAAAGAAPEPLEDGPTAAFARRMASETGIHVHASLYERADGPDGLGYNTAIVVAPDGALVAYTRKLHIPVTAGYYEDRYFRPGPVDGGAGVGEGASAPGGEAVGAGSGPSGSEAPILAGGPFPVLALGDAKLGFPTCWDQWFPELARAYSLAGAEVIVYPTAIGSEPDHPAFDTEPLWERVIVGNGIANGTFMVAVNRIGDEGPLTFYGSSFISDPYGRVLVQGPRDRPAVLVADLDLDQRGDWLDLFPFLTTRRPDAYEPLVERPAKPASAGT
ncbi:MAG TPA: nitrilase-related carbon-nitrogen hydrolase [Conexibacter sp.]|jgi:N-carbamoylputrescine amidase